MRRRGVVRAGAEQQLVAEERAHGRETPRDRRRGEPVRPHRGEPALELVGRDVADRCAAEGGERREVAPVGVDRARRALRGEEQEEALDVLVGSLRHGRWIRGHRPSVLPR